MLSTNSAGGRGEEDGKIEQELEEIQSQLQERAAKVIHQKQSGGSSFTRFSSPDSPMPKVGVGIIDAEEVKKVTPRRPSLTNNVSMR